MKKKGLAVFLMLSMYCGPAYSLVIGALDSGTYVNTGSHSSSNPNYVAGRCIQCTEPGLYRNFFVFNVPQSGTITSATLRIDSTEVSVGGLYTLWSIESDLQRLRDGGVGLTDIYNDLGTGELFGETVIFANQDYVMLEIELNALAIASMNATGGLWAIGGNYASSGYAFGFSVTGTIRELVITQVVPIPGALGLLLASLISLLGFRGRSGH